MLVYAPTHTSLPHARTRSHTRARAQDDIGVEMLRAGLVRVRRSELRTRYRELLADAQKRKVGLWDSAAKL